MNKEPDVWIGVSADHLTPDLKREASKAKEEIIEQQRGKTMIRAPFEMGDENPKKYFIKTLAGLNTYLDKAMEILTKPTVIVLGTKGSSDRWVRERKRVDGDDYYKNDESSGVTMILLNMMVRDGENHMAVIDVQKIIEDELDGVPNLPENVGKLLKSEWSILTGESVVKHIKRLENSFFQKLDGVLYVALNDLARRFRRYRLEIPENPWDFDLRPNANDGLLANFHTVFPNETFFKNPYEMLADFSDLKKLRDS
ncbi:MAG: hypothetical protein VX367_08430, partial [SAR324 cluster bacterium]|nr:hypothetical protein [SAR324 cluster bacterium]